MALEHTILGQVHLKSKSTFMRTRRIMVAIIIMAIITPSCNYCKLFGDNKLGNNFSLLEGDKDTDRLIVYCTGDKRCCNAGIPVLPSRSDSTSSYVVDAISSEKWIIAITKDANMIESYWIINKDFEADFNYDDGGKLESIILSQVTGPMNIDSFRAEKRKLGISLKLNR